jgi:hypothetical protein
MLAKLNNARKALVSALGVLLSGLLLAQNFSAFLPHTVGVALGTLIGLLTPVVTYLTPNKTPAAS